ncbi:DUF3093 domain-containing protein [Streptomyces albus]|uniref:DUF3093 domain-containing protein n=1 Tax=Streptomyces albus TaxID=1888 RepID=A0A6C1C6E3_9ACTN|nr:MULTISPECIES: DUF3093 domain-containing protein [Streptomyces]KPC91044.1 membrane protein [Streptomyces sp. NRRL F-6602]EPD94149.1 hypothetical protein HMPREF1486_03439 [Streptomyces sp. HPH0547]MDI6412686.1 DUF3093 domain-containing protein [Streptomyces albus]QID38588.1 DUF3093 domain-containing protein [Streptomyces albus]TGG80357.1 DUF3093 domain-containing protein [Streptomyces albus]
MHPASSPYDERLTAPRSWWLIAAGIGVGCALMLFPLGLLPALCGLVGGAALAAVCVSSYGGVRVRVVAGSLVAGDARIPLSALGEAEALEGEEARAWRTYKADTRAHMVLRGYVPTAVRIEVTDPEDPTPYVYVSTRHPEELVAALRAARETSRS